MLAVAPPRELIDGSAIPLEWTPDSRALVVGMTERATADGERQGLWFVPLAAGQPRKLDVDGNTWQIGVGGFSLHPDGQHIAFSGAVGKEGQEIWALENFLPAPTTRR